MCTQAVKRIGEFSVHASAGSFGTGARRRIGGNPISSPGAERFRLSKIATV